MGALIAILVSLMNGGAAADAAVPGAVAAAALPATAAAGAPPAFKDCETCPEMVLVPAGEFVMGVPPGEEEREGLYEDFRRRSEPRRRVKVRSFLAGKYEVTRGEYRVFAESTGRGGAGCFQWTGSDFAMDATKSWRDAGYPQGDDHPVACVSWEDAAAYADWLSGRTGKRYRLLTEAEWEYAARAGTTTARFWGDDPNAACRYANGADLAMLTKVPRAPEWTIARCNDGHPFTAPAGSYRPNAFGVHDMLGNVWEWTQDCWNANYAGAPDDGSAWLTGDCYLRSVRGGSWDDQPLGLRAAYRVGSPVVIRVYGRGFRVARDE